MQRLSELWLDLLFGLLLLFLTSQAADSIHQKNQLSPVVLQQSVFQISANYIK
ncbi:hypothetical protein Sta7437_1540 [Stanieria cyanosphaera PCC 7437]|uniref:Uncharacterized protein n=1 Tax=Stanieria cyanosphaera (strain ATCC 29371 / PCC 7437) TaxID=111780 RepID=K9XTX5_STAC7|nr:hypothetical protein [Stanieria cyanosphaera]AFZ35107.1 hypothetical protein Sta7437_1540 [Stanieria cyanosphaera PCC 7437]